MLEPGNQQLAKLFSVSLIFAAIFSLVYLGKNFDSWQKIEGQTASVASTVTDRFFCFIGDWIGFSCEVDIPEPVIEYANVTPPSAPLPPSKPEPTPTSTIVQNIINEYVTTPVEREVVREVVVQSGSVDTSRFVTQDEYDRQVEALLTSIERSSGGHQGIDNESLEDLEDVASMSQNSGDLLTWNGTSWTNSATSSLGINSSQWTTLGSDIYYDIGRVSIGTTATSAKLTIANTATFGSELVTNGTFTGSATGWMLESGCSIYSSNQVTVLYDATCQGDAGWPALSTYVSLVSGTTYVLTFDITANGSPAYIYFDNTSNPTNEGPFGTGSHSVSFTADYTGTDILTFESWNWYDDTGWSIDNVSLREVSDDTSPAFALYDITGAATAILGQLNNNVAIGRNALSGATNAHDSNFLGYSAGSGATTASYSNFLGYSAGADATNAYNSNFLGYSAGADATDAYNSNFFGYQAGYQATNATRSNFLGYEAGYFASNATDSNFIGVSAGASATNATRSNFFGYQAGYQATNATRSNFLGYSAGSGATTASYSNFLGYEAGYSASNASYSNFLGYSAGSRATNASYSNFLGYEAGYFASSASDSNFFGRNAGYAASSASYSNFLGYQAGRQATNATRSNFLGYQAGYQATNARYSTFIGYRAGYQDTVNNGTGSSSIAIGRYAGTGGYSDSIALGHGVINSAARQLNIGNILYGTGLYASDTQSSTPTSGNIGIGTSTPSSKLTIVGTAGNTLAFTVASSTGSSMLTIAADGNATFVGSGGTCTINGSGACSSDERLKTGFNPLDNQSALDNLMTLRTGTYRWKDTSWDQSENIGVLAQDLLEVYPQLVGTAPTTFNGETGTYYTVNYAGLTVPIIAAIKELNLKLEDLATTTLTIDSDSFTSRFFDRLIAWFADATNGIGTMVASVFNATEMICVDGECLTAEDVRDLKKLTGSETGDLDDEDQNEDGGGIVSSDPIITLIGDSEVTLTVGDTYEELSATAVDSTGLDITASIVVGGDSVDTTLAGTYEVTYTVTDANGLTATVTRTVTVVEEEPPIEEGAVTGGESEDQDGDGEPADPNTGDTEDQTGDDNPPAPQDDQLPPAL